MEDSRSTSSNPKTVVCSRLTPLSHQEVAVKKSERELLGKLAATLTTSNLDAGKPVLAAAGILEELAHDVSPPLAPKSGKTADHGAAKLLERGTPRDNDSDILGVNHKTGPNASRLAVPDPSLSTFNPVRQKTLQGRSLAISVAVAAIAGLVTGIAWPWKPLLDPTAFVAQKNGAQSVNSDLIASAERDALTLPTPATVDLSEISAQLNVITQGLSSLRDEVKALETRQENVAQTQEQLTTRQARLALSQEEAAAKQAQALQAISRLISAEQNKHRSPASTAPSRVTATTADRNVAEPTSLPSQQQDSTRLTPPLPVPDHYIPLNQ